MSELPENWIEISFIESCDQISVNELKVKQKDYLQEGTLPVVDQGKELIGGYTNEIFRAIPAPPPYIVFGDHTKVLKYVDFQFAPGADGIKVLKPIGFYLPRLFDYFSRILGVRIPNKGYARHFQHLASQEIPLPPLAEQHRIVAKIEELFSDLDAGIASLKKAKEQLNFYRQAVLKCAFDGTLTKEWRDGQDQKESVIWNDVHLKDVLSSPLINGRSVPTKKDGFPVLRLTAIRGKYIDASQTKEGDWAGFDPKSYAAIENDFLVSRGNGTLELVGRGAAVGKNVQAAFPDTMIRIRLSKDISLDFFYWVWKSRLVRSQIEKFAKTTAGIYKINQGNMEAIKFPLMLKIEQEKIVSEIESRLSEADNLDKTLDAALAQSESLRQSILKQAFEGKLVPQDPNDEPAEKLLERIRAERAASDEAPKKRQTTEERGRYGGGSPSETRSVAARPGTPVEGGAPKPRRGKPQGKKATAAKRRG